MIRDDRPRLTGRLTDECAVVYTASSTERNETGERRGDQRRQYGASKSDTNSVRGGINATLAPRQRVNRRKTPGFVETSENAFWFAGCYPGGAIRNEREVVFDRCLCADWREFAALGLAECSSFSSFLGCFCPLSTPLIT